MSTYVTETFTPSGRSMSWASFGTREEAEKWAEELRSSYKSARKRMVVTVTEETR
jgi:hypothetical protein